MMTKLASLNAMLVSNFSKQVRIKLTSESDLEFHLQDGKSVLIDLFKVCWRQVCSGIFVDEQ